MKSPMVVWLQHGADDDTPYSELSHEDITWADQFCFSNDYGPYVDLRQFIEEVEREAQACADEGLNYDVAFVDIIRDKVKELKNKKT